MNSLATNCGIGFTQTEQVFCLRERDSELFWDGRTWESGMESARGYSDLDGALAVAHRGNRGVDLVIVYPSRQRTLVIPLE